MVEKKGAADVKIERGSDMDNLVFDDNSDTGSMNSGTDASNLEATTQIPEQGVVKKEVAKVEPIAGQEPKEEKKDNLETQTTEEPKEDDIVEVNEAGDLVDSTGKVLAAKGEFTVNEDGTVELLQKESEGIKAVLEQVKNDYGIELKDEQGNPLKFENTVEGTAQLIGVAAEKLHEKHLNDLFEEYPQFKHYLNHVVAGGSDEEFFSAPTNFRKVSIPADTETNKEANRKLRENLIIQKEFIARGGANLQGEAAAKLQQEAADYAAYILDKGQEGEKAKDALAWLQSFEKQEQDARNKANEATIAANKVQVEQYWENVRNAVVTGELKDGKGNATIVIPKNERDAFYKYLAAPVGNTGKSQAQIDREKQSHSMGLTLEYLRYKEFDLNKFIEAKAQTKQAEKLEVIANAGAKASKKTTGMRVKTGTTNFSKLNLGFLTSPKS